LKAIRSQKNGNTVILMYTMLITVAVNSNAEGRLMLCEGIPYTEEILSGILNFSSAEVTSGLQLLVKFGLLSVTDSVFSLVNYNEYADLKAVKERRQNADRQAKFKAKRNEDDVIPSVTDTAAVTARKSVKTASDKDDA
jgi:hypothetical protein